MKIDFLRHIWDKALEFEDFEFLVSEFEKEMK